MQGEALIEDAPKVPGAPRLNWVTETEKEAVALCKLANPGHQDKDWRDEAADKKHWAAIIREYLTAPGMLGQQLQRHARTMTLAQPPLPIYIVTLFQDAAAEAMRRSLQPISRGTGGHDIARATFRPGSSTLYRHKQIKEWTEVWFTIMAVYSGQRIPERDIKECLYDQFTLINQVSKERSLNRLRSQVDKNWLRIVAITPSLRMLGDTNEGCAMIQFPDNPGLEMLVEVPLLSLWEQIMVQNAGTCLAISEIKTQLTEIIRNYLTIKKPEENYGEAWAESIQVALDERIITVLLMHKSVKRLDDKLRFPENRVAKSYR